MAVTVKHPLAFGFLRVAPAQLLYTVVTAQRITLKTIKLRNEDDSYLGNIIYTPKITIFNRGRSFDLTPNIPSLRPGFTLELIHDNNEIILDPGSMILGENNVDNKVSFVIDGLEDNRIE